MRSGGVCRSTRFLWCFVKQFMKFINGYLMLLLLVQAITIVDFVLIVKMAICFEEKQKLSNLISIDI